MSPALAPKAKDAPAPSIVKSGPVVLDKFGNFRLASTEVVKPPSPARRETNRCVYKLERKLVTKNKDNHITYDDNAFLTNVMDCSLII